ncbi:MAG: phage Mu protein F-like protein [Bacteroidetes bacterium]|jgi:SPP1 gp7 family putative phage head morphogenesis protein|nr:phage Mu protein F-like protein [Bacteroidota bacterium]
MVIASCKYCNHIENADKINLFSDDETNKILESIFDGSIKIDSLSIEMYEKIATRLTDAVFKGFGKNLFNTEFGTPDHKMLESLRENVYVFSAAKTYQQTKEISSLLTNKDGKVSFSDFKKQAKTVFEKHNENYLYAEYNSAIAQARSASMWMDFEKDKSIYPQLEYLTAGDARVRIEHAALNGIIRRVDDKFWDLYMPPNGFNCRCTVLQVRGEMETDLSTKTPPTKKEVPEIFRFNAGKEKIIFSKSHPYFEVPKEDKKLALKNFNLPLPKKTVKGEFQPATTINDVVSRMLKAGVESVNLKGMDIEHANSVLKAVESENAKSPLKLSSIETFKRKSSRAKALYYYGSQKITINIDLVGYKAPPVSTYPEQIEKIVKQIETVKGYIGNNRYSQSDVLKSISRLNRSKTEIEYKMLKNEPIKKWSMSTTDDTKQSLERTIIHEIGHHRDEMTKKSNLNFFFNKNTAPTTYGATNKAEYFAEWYTSYRVNGDKDVPKDILKIFEHIDGKH